MPSALATATAVLEKFGRVLTYPGDGYLFEVEACVNAANEIDVEAGRLMGEFRNALRGLSIEQAQELYVQTFDLNPICALEVGWQLYGDNYDRGNFLVKMRQELERHSVPENVELPDHLCNVLPLLARVDHAETRSFTEASVRPALKKMLAAFAGKGNPFENVLKALDRLVEASLSSPLQEANHD
jgi:nitrate reductase molybdenum cofactor assembly chaperone